MLFNSYIFMIFLPLVFLGYWFVFRRLWLQNLFVVAASYLFYGWWDWRFLILIAFTSLWAWLFGLMERGDAPTAGSRWRLALSCVINLGILAIFKYYDFFVGSAASLLESLGWHPNLPMLKIVLPVGISFYTFQSLSYTIDVYRRNLRPTRDVVAFLAFVSFFPQLVAGPIERATNLLPQFLKPRRFDRAFATDGCRQMLWGFFKKMVVADNCAIAADALLADSSNGVAYWGGMFCFALQIYGDFSGYSDIAIGCSKLFGIRLMCNFAYPYFSRDIAEFWRRWHISLTTWFRDYIYIPMGGSRGTPRATFRNTLVVFLVSGLWHGANWTFVVWGAFHALCFLPLMLLKRNRSHLDTVAETRCLPSLRELGMMLTTFLVVLVGWVFFRAQTLSQAWDWLVMMGSVGSFSLLEDPPHEFSIGMIAVALCLVVEWINRRLPYGFARLPSRTWLRWLIYFVMVGILLFQSPGSQSFIYFQF